MDVSIMIEGQMGLNWARWQAIARAVEDAGFAGLYRSDHFVNPAPPDVDSLEMVVSLTWLAQNTQRIRFGALVSPVSFRDPVMLARQAAAIQELGGGRLIHGLGAGWMEREHTMFGYELGTPRARSDRLEEAVRLTLALLGGESVSFEGRYYRLSGASLHPKPASPPPLMIGGNGPRRTLPLAARFAGVWNGFSLTPDAFRGKNERLDELLAAAGRRPEDLRRTMMTALILGSDDAAAMRARGAIAGSLADVRPQLADLAAAGCEEVMLQWFALDDLPGLSRLADAALP